ncbi:MAG TPA: xanthine dehydrogenase family protein molybdopterin-binding subunit, partial [Crenalkalicoccus sp.]|nr:xanthine dehydrogenase family protein molybdopterin-binding subunit [Crenalkalicoccus sp.]
IVPRLSKFNFVATEMPVLPRERVHYVGQPVAAVVAPTAERAEDLADDTLLDIAPEPPVIGLAAALAPGVSLVHPQAAGNVLVDARTATPGCADAFAAAALVVEIAPRSHRQNAMPLESRGGVASFDRATGRVTLTCSTQAPHLMRSGIAECLGLAESELRVMAPDVGGGFGQKMSLFPEYVVLVWLALRHRGAFAWIEDRRENLIAAAHSRDQAHRLRGAFDEGGRLLALEVEILADVGAFSCHPFTCGMEPLMALTEYPGSYAVPEYAARARAVATHTCPMAPYRGVSRPAITFGLERLMDVAARRIGIAPEEIRRHNLVRRFPHRTPTGLVLDEASYLETMEDAVTEADLPGFRARQAAARAEGRHIGIGISVFNERTGYGTPAFAARGMEITPGFERVAIEMLPSGEVEARIGASPHGQGLRTALAQVVADALGTVPERVRIVHGDTDRTPYGWGSFASRSAVISGGACRLAAEKLAETLRRCAARLLQAAPGEVSLRDGAAVVEATGASLPLAELARTAHFASQLLVEEAPDGLAAVATYDPEGTFANACHIAEVAVDAETGRVEVTRFIVAEDAGRLINPLIVDGQIQGGIAQGIANALLEEVLYDADGQILTGSLADYLPPTAAEIPPIEIHHRVTESTATLTGAKGVGEGGAIGAPAAVVNAICDALGLELFEMPATPERIRAALRAREEGR